MTFAPSQYNLEVIALGDDAVRVPYAGGDLAAPARELLTLAVLDDVEAHVVLEGVGARDVVVVRAREPEHEAARAVDLAGHGLAAHGEIDVAKDSFGHEGDGKGLSVASASTCART